MATPPRPATFAEAYASIEQRPSNAEPSAYGAVGLSTRRLRSNSGGPLPQDLDEMSPAETNSIAPPAPVYKIVLTGGPCGGKTTSLARVSIMHGAA